MNDYTDPGSGPSSIPLRRPLDDRVLAGVCAGLARTLGMDPTIVRLLWMLFTLAFGTGLLAYLICAAVIPDDNGQRSQVALIVLVLFVVLPMLCGLCAFPLGVLGSLSGR
jgi:phage shock protein PspC (stress-responsive transcriptional regulator)